MSDKFKDDALSKAEDIKALSRRQVLSTKELFSSLFGSFIEPLFDSLNTFDDTLFSYNEDGSLNVTVEVPGMKQEDLRVSIMDDEGGGYLLEVNGEVKTEHSVRSISESVTIPPGYKLEPTQTLEHGLLTLTFPLLDPDKK